MEYVLRLHPIHYNPFNDVNAWPGGALCDRDPPPSRLHRKPHQKLLCRSPVKKIKTPETVFNLNSEETQTERGAVDSNRAGVTGNRNVRHIILLVVLSLRIRSMTGWKSDTNFWLFDSQMCFKATSSDLWISLIYILLLTCTCEKRHRWMCEMDWDI